MLCGFPCEAPLAFKKECAVLPLPKIALSAADYPRPTLAHGVGDQMPYFVAGCMNVVRIESVTAPDALTGR